MNNVGSNINSGLQENRGKRWTLEEDTFLLQQINFLSHYDIGRHLKRSENAVLSRLRKLAFHMIQNGEDPLIVQQNLKLSDEDISQINNECFIYSKKLQSSKFISSTKKIPKKGYFTNTQQSQEIQLLLEIRNMLRRLLLQNDPIKSPRCTTTEGKSNIRVSEINFEDFERKSEEFAKIFDS
jgi:hypothetical protein